MSNRLTPYLACAAALLAGLFVLIVPEWVRPPLVSKEYGPSALEMVTFTDPRRIWPFGTVPAPLPPAEPGSPKATDVYKNVQVLTELSKNDFDRLMVAMTQWVAPKQGCAFCHDYAKGYAYDGLYTNKVTRQQIKMTQAMNTNWGNHLAPSGVTCYTCHRGEAMPPRLWYKQPEAHHAGLLGKPRPWQVNAPTIRQFFPNESYEAWFLNGLDGHIQSRAALPGEPGSGVAPEHKAEMLYILMMQMSDALGVNCNYCHNSRVLYDWSQGTPNRVVGWWAMDQTMHTNKDYIEPLQSLLPQDHLGQMGDVGKVECGTCHVEKEKPLDGFDLLSHYPGLGPPDGVKAGIDQYIRDIAKPIEVEGPAYNPTPTVVKVNIPAYPDPAAPAPAPQPAPTASHAELRTGSNPAPASPLPARDGVYCGPKDETITVDGRRNTVEIGGYTCGYPIIAADKLQSAQCWRKDEKPDRREFDVRLLDNTLIYNERSFTLCRPLPPDH